MRRRQEKFKRSMMQETREKISREVVLPETITIQELSQRMSERAVDVIKYLMKEGQMMKPGDVIDADLAELIAGEFGHTILFPDGRPCPCGNHGCLEQYISEASVLNDFAAAEGLENVSVERFIQYYQEGNPNARKVMQDFTHYIGISLNTVLHTFNPDVIVINSSFTNYIPGLIDEITSGIQNRLRWYLHVLPAHLQDVSVLMGGISLCSRNFLGISTFKLLDL